MIEFKSDRSNTEHVDEPYEAISYNDRIETLRLSEYPTLNGTIYLDHAGTTPYAKSLVEAWSNELTANLFGNPHSASASSQLSTRRMEEIRLKTLRFFGADPDHFDIVFVANATSAVKLVAEAFRDLDKGFWYMCHADSHTSLVGCRELAAQGSQCFADDLEVDEWLDQLSPRPNDSGKVSLLAFSGQSNMTGRQLPLRWCERVTAVRKDYDLQVYSLLDAASLAATSPLALHHSTGADFTCVSFYKIFGLPDLGGLIIKKASAGILMRKKYFAGGTVDAVAVGQDSWYARKASISASLEEGTLPFHNILALDHAMTIHQRLFNSMSHVRRHVTRLARRVRTELKSLKHPNGTSVARLYGDEEGDRYGPVLSFNLLDSKDRFLSAAEVEKLCIVKGIQLRTGGLCNPGGAAKHFHLSGSLLRQRWEQGKRCGDERDLVAGQPIGSIRISLGAMSTTSDVDAFIGFVKEYFVATAVGLCDPPVPLSQSACVIDELAVYPIKSCGPFVIPSDTRWGLTEDGLAWDREWCLVQEGTNVALSQKRCPKMAKLRPAIDLERRRLVVRYQQDGPKQSIAIPLDDHLAEQSSTARTCHKINRKMQQAQVCGDILPVYLYVDPEIKAFFSNSLGVSCTLARYSHQSPRRAVSIRRPGSRNKVQDASRDSHSVGLANESPLLIVSQASIDELNAHIQRRALTANVAAKEVTARSFRANIVIGRSLSVQPYAEDEWSAATLVPFSQHVNQGSAASNASISSQTASLSSSAEDAGVEQTPMSCINILGPCQRCQMVSIDQKTSQSHSEPFSTLAKTRRKGDGRVWFGVHASLANITVGQCCHTTVGVGDRLLPVIDV